MPLKRNSNQWYTTTKTWSSQHSTTLAPGALPHDVLDKILNHTLSVARKRNMVSFVNYASQNLFKLSPALICIHTSTSETPSFAREGK